MLNQWHKDARPAHYTITGQPLTTASSNFSSSFSSAFDSQVKEEIVSTRTRLLLTSAKVDVRPTRTLHVTSRCERGPHGRGCGATHFALGTDLPLSPTSTLSPVSSEASYSSFSEHSRRTNPELSRSVNLDVSSLDSILADVDDMLENKTSTEWRSSFQHVREKFNIPGARVTPSSSTDSITPTPGSPDVVPSAYYSLPRPKKLNWDGGMPNGNNTLQPIRAKPTELSSFWWNSMQNSTVVSKHSPNASSPAVSSSTSTSGYASYHIETASSPVTPGDLLDSPGYVPRQNGAVSEHRTIESIASIPAPTYPNSNVKRPLSFSELNAIMQEDTTPYGSLKRPQQPPPNKPKPQPLVITEPPAPQPIPLNQATVNASVADSKLNQSKRAELPNFSALDSAVEAVLNIAAKKHSPPQAAVATRMPAQPDANAIDEVSDLLRKSAKIANQPTNAAHGLNVIEEVSNLLRKSATMVEKRLDSVDTFGKLRVDTDLLSPHSPSPSDTASSVSEYTPAGLPHPKPKHHLREQLLSMGVEPRSPTFQRSGGWAFSLPNTGSVAARVMEFEKRPVTPPTPPAVQSGPAGSAVQPTVYRSKPVIHVNLSRPRKPDLGPALAQDVTPISTKAKDKDAISSPIQTVSATVPEPRPSSNLEKTFAQLREPIAPPPVAPVHKPQRQASSENVPRFYFPRGKPSPLQDESLLKRVATVFSNSQGEVTVETMGEVVKECDLPLYWKRPVLLACSGNGTSATFQQFSAWWKGMCQVAHDEASRFIYTLAGPQRRHLVKEDFEPIIQDLVDTFPGLSFLREAPEFHSRYVQTVIARIFFCVNRSWSGKITVQELRRSNFLEILGSLEEKDDINTVTDFFSYEHFYVIYCKFWELDRDHDLVISKMDLARHEGGAISARIIDRIFSGAVSRDSSVAHERMNYADFVAFILAEEDKKHPTSIEYWFRCLDLDGDGILSMYELEYFYAEMERKMEAAGIEAMKYSDVLCQMLDLINPREDGKVRLSDLKRSRMGAHFLNAFINMHKYYDQEVSDSSDRAAVKNETGEEMTDWERYCAEQYELLMQEDQGNEDDVEDTEINCDDSDEEIELSQSAPADQLRGQKVTLMETL